MYRLGGWVEWGVKPNVLLQAVTQMEIIRYMEIHGDADTDTASDGWKMEINILIDI